MPQMTMKFTASISLLLAALALQPSGLRAEVKAIHGNGFTVQHQISTKAGPQQVYAAMKEIGSWWNPEHSWSAKADNLYFDDRVGGCFCERLPGGGVEHLRIIYLAPNKEIRFEGALGPLQGMATHGRMIWSIAPGEEGTQVTFTYHVTGFMDGGFEGLAPVVDGVISEQLERLKGSLAP